jgi:hypothetical protein
MLSDEVLLARAKRLIEDRVGWGNAADWTNQDFIALSKRIRQDSGASVSHITLKRLWGKVKYNGLPQIYTLNTLVQFLGYEGWRDFKVKNAGDPAAPELTAGDVCPEPTNGQVHTEVNVAYKSSVSNAPSKGRRRLSKILYIAAILTALAAGFIFYTSTTKKKIDPKDYAFNSRQILQAGIPNSVVFNYDATKSPSDSVIIQQSWDARLRTTIAKDQHQHTLIYYFPGFFNPKLLVNGQIVKELDLLIKSDGWLTVAGATPTPVYFAKKDVIANGKMSLPIDKIKAQHLDLGPQAPLLSYINVQDFGEIYTDDFVFETSLRNDYREGSSVCQMTNIYLLCEGTAIGIPLCAKGCESAISFFFTDFRLSGKEKDLSAFGVDFNKFVKVRIESANGKAKIFLDDKLAYLVDHPITRSKIIGIDFVFQGTGSVDYVKLSDKSVSFDDEF